VATVEWGALARQDLLSIIGFISDDNPEAAQRFKNEIEARIADLASHPKMYKAGREAGTREMVVYPNYVVVYRENTETVIILRILHAARQWPA
jgi:plasmid stabilization system protein ParE